MSEPVDNDQPTFAYFLLPLQTALRLPHELQVEFPGRRGYDHVWHEAVAQGKDMPDAEEIVSYVSICHRAREKNPVEFRTVDMMRLWDEIAPWASHEGKPEERGVPPEPTRRASVLEVAVMVDPSKLSDPEASKFQPLVQALECVQVLQRAYHLASHEDLAYLNAAALPLLIPFVLAEGTPEGPHPIDHQVIFNYESSEWLGFASSDEVSSDAFNNAVLALEAGHPFLRFQDLRREARWHRKAHASSWSSLVLIATAAELLLNTVLQMLLWEEGLTPEEAAHHFPMNQSLGMRLARSVAPRLGGNWSTKKSGAVKDWHEHVAQRRNLALHAGSEVSVQDVDEALDALEGLSQYLISRLCIPERLARFPYTALALMGQPGLERRELWTRRVAAAAAYSDDYMARFIQWNDLLSLRISRPTNDDRLPSSDTLGVLMVVIHAGHAYWIVHYPELKKAAPASVNQSVIDRFGTQIKVFLKTFAERQVDQPQSVAIGAPASEWSALDPLVDENWLVPMANALKEGDDFERSPVQLHPETRL